MGVEIKEGVKILINKTPYLIIESVLYLWNNFRNNIINMTPVIAFIVITSVAS